ncbi:MAG: hypothetical protein JWP34_4679, partial [Massilia sp.]|nr:hypothetical protein [Massilia sp.]
MFGPAAVGDGRTGKGLLMSIMGFASEPGKLFSWYLRANLGY